MYKRLSEKEEMEIFSPESEKINIENFEKILECFFLSEKTHNRVLDNIYGNRSEEENYLDKLLKLNKQRRAWFNINDKEKIDPAYIYYTNIIRDHARYDSNLKNLSDEVDFISYDVFDSGMVTYKKQKRKLFKFLIDNNILEQFNIDKINSLRTNGEMRLCISRNPIDYLFVSTNQSFSSCLNLKSSAEGCSWAGLGSISVDPNRFLMFLSSGKIKKYYLKRCEFKHFGYRVRSWGLITENDKIITVYNYPSNFDYETLFSYLGIDNSHYGWPDSCRKSKFKFEIPRHENDEVSFIYIDNIGISSKGNEYWYDYSGYTGFLTSFESELTFEEIESIDDLYNSYHSHCYDCECRMSDDEGYIVYDNLLCENCFDENYFTCRQCSEARNNDDSYNVDGCLYCEYCYREYFIECNKCEEPFPNEEVHETSDGNCYCESCYNEITFECDECGEREMIEDSEEAGKVLCYECRENLKREIS